MFIQSGEEARFPPFICMLLIIIIVIIIILSFMLGIAATLRVLLMVHITLSSLLNTFVFLH
jgi:hypothetical protein